MDGLLGGLAGLLIGVLITWAIIRNATRSTELLDELRKVVSRQDTAIARLETIGNMLDERLESLKHHASPDDR